MERRSSLLFWGASSAIVTGSNAAIHGFTWLSLVLGGFVAYALGLAVVEYVDCAFPTDPDLGSRLSFG